MRVRNKQMGMVGPAFIALGLALLVLGFFGGSLGIPGLAVVNQYWGPENATLYIYPVASASEPNWVVTHYWYGYSDTEPGVYHVIDGSEVKVYIDGQYYTTLVTRSDKTVFYTPVSRLGAGQHEIKFVYEGTPGKPYPPDEHIEYVTIGGDSVQVDTQDITPSQSTISLLLKVGGCVLALIGSAVMVLGGSGRGRR